MHPNTRPSLLRLTPARGLSVAVALFVGLSPFVRAQSAAPAPAAADQTGTEALSPEALDDLLGPIALYPDALIALILPASTVPSDVTLAARYLANGGDPDQVDDQSWDSSVKSLVRYPDVVKWMDDNLEWTTSVGDTFIAQPADVMTAIQRLRGEAQAAGNLVDTPQQTVVKQVVEKQTYISIVPAEPDVIYVPEYNPEVVYVERQPDWVGPVIGFGAGFAVGSWLNYGCDWQDRGVYYGDYRQGWDRGDWNRGGNGNNNGNNYVNNNTNIVNNNVNVNNISRNSAKRWQPSSQSRRQLAQHSATYNKRVKAANAEVRHHNAVAGNKAGNKAAKPRGLKSLPQPTHFAANKKGNHPNQKNTAAAKAPATNKDKANGNKGGDKKHPGQAPNVTAAKGNGKNNANQPNANKPNANAGNKGNAQNKGNGGNNGNANKGNGKKSSPKAPSAAPAVNGQGNKNKPKNNGGNGAQNGGKKQPSSQGQKPNKPKSAPNAQPANHPKKSQPAAAPQHVNKPSKPASAPKHNQSAPQSHQPKPQASAPSRPKNSGGGGGGNKAQSNKGNGGGGGNKPQANKGNGGSSNDKKKKDKK